MTDAPATERIRETLRDDIVRPFRTARSGVIGRVVRLGPTIDTILSRHNASEPISHTLGEAVALTVMLGTALKFEGKLTLQTKTDGLLDFLVVNFETPGRVRAYVRYDNARLDALISDGAGIDQGALLGAGYLAMTIDPGDDMDRYQGIVALDGESLGEAALTYFRQSEQLPTFLRLAVARHYVAGENGEPGQWRWRAGGLMIQNLAGDGGKPRAPVEEEADEQRLPGEDDDDWERARILASTVEDHELLDPTLSPERLLFRLFHEEGVRALPLTPVEAHCRCSRKRVEGFLRSFGAEELVDMREADGSVSVTCEFCTATYRFRPDELS